MEADPKTLGVAGVVAMGLLGLVSWVVKKVFTLIAGAVKKHLEQSEKMVNGALDNMRANTEAINANVAAIGANTEATLRHINACDVRAQLAAKDVEAQKQQLSRIESDVRKIRVKGGGGHDDT